MGFGNRLKYARKYIGITQKALAQKLGVTPSMIAQYETGKRNPKKVTLTEIAAALNLNCGFTKAGTPYFYVPVDTITDENEKDRQFNYRQFNNAFKEDKENGHVDNEYTALIDERSQLLKDIKILSNYFTKVMDKTKSDEQKTEISEAFQELAHEYDIDLYDAEQAINDHIRNPRPKHGSMLNTLLDILKNTTPQTNNENFQKLSLDFSVLNKSGEREAAKRVHELTYIPEYRKDTTPESPSTDAPGTESPSSTDKNTS